MPDLDSELARLRFQIKQLGEVLDHRRHPIASLVIELNWSEEDLDRAHDIFEKYDNQLEVSEQFNEHELERDLKEAFGITYQTVKTIVNAFWRNDQWTPVCKAYAAKHDVAEFKEINRGNED